VFHLFWIVLTIAIGGYSGYEVYGWLDPKEIKSPEFRALIGVLVGALTFWSTYRFGFFLFRPIIRLFTNPISPIKRKADGLSARFLLFSYLSIITFFQIYLLLPLSILATLNFWSSKNQIPTFPALQGVFPYLSGFFFLVSALFVLALLGDYFENRIFKSKDWYPVVFFYSPIFLFFTFSYLDIGAVRDFWVLVKPYFMDILKRLLESPFYSIETLFYTLPYIFFGGTPAALGIIIFYCFFLSFLRTIHEPGWFFKIAKATFTLRDHLRRSGYGLGGSSRFATFWKEWEFPYYKGGLLLGKSLYGDLFVGLDDDRHFITIAGSRGGKGIAYIIPNLLLWPQNIICLDPKGANTEVTARKRETIHGQAVHVIDPYSKTSPKHLHRRYNPLKEVDVYSPDCVKQIDIITRALIVSSGDKNKYWDESAEKIIKGFIAHILTAPVYEGDRSLVAVYKALLQPQKEFLAILEAMARNPGCHGLAIAAAAILSNASGEHRGSLLGTVSTHIKFLEDPRVQDLLGGESDFSMFDLPSTPTSIYLVLEGNDLFRLNRFMRLFILLAFYAMENPKGGTQNRTRKTLFILDEFYSLGHMPILEKAAGYVAGIGVKLWPILQNIGQLQDLYGKNWETFIDNAAAMQVFSLAGQGTKDYVMQKLGETRSMVEDVSQLSYEKKGWGGTSSRNTSSYQIRPLLTSNELEKELSRSRARSIIFPNGEDPLILERVPYFELFHQSMYDQDPDYIGAKGPSINYGWTATKYFGSNSPILLQAAQQHLAKPLVGELLNALGPIPERLELTHSEPLPFTPPQAESPQLLADPAPENPAPIAAPNFKTPDTDGKSKDARAFQDALEIMGLQKGFTLPDLKKQYSALIDTIHADLLPDLEHAYYTLKDPKFIQAHDEANTRIKDLKALALPDSFTQEDLEEAYLDNLNELSQKKLNAAYERLKRG